MLKFAIIGCGEVSKLHADQIQRLGSLKAVCDILSERADSLASSYGAKAWYDADELLLNENEVDVVVVCTPNGYHAEHCIKSLQAGKHVLCESPFCITKAAAWQMIETEKFCRKKLFVVNSTRDNEALKQLKKTVEDHTRDHFYSFELKTTVDANVDHEKEWQYAWFPGGGSLYSHFNGYVESMIYLFGSIEEAKGFSDNIQHKTMIDIDDSGEAALTMRNGIPGNIKWSLNAQNKEEAVLQVITLNDPLTIGGIEKMIYNKEQDYERIYNWFTKDLPDQPSNIYDATKTVEAIEKIYKAVSSNHSNH